MADNPISISDDEKWEVEGDVRTLKEAEMIKKDDKRLNKAMHLMSEEMGAMKSSMQDAAEKMFPNTNHLPGS